MRGDLASQFRSLAQECRQQAALFMEEGEYYGWKLESIETRPLGDFTQCTLDFDQERIVFLTRRKLTSVGTPTSDDERLAVRLEAIWQELERERTRLPIDEAHLGAWAALRGAQVALEEALQALQGETSEIVAP